MLTESNPQAVEPAVNTEVVAQAKRRDDLCPQRRAGCQHGGIAQFAVAMSIAPASLAKKISVNRAAQRGSRSQGDQRSQG